MVLSILVENVDNPEVLLPKLQEALSFKNFNVMVAETRFSLETATEFIKRPDTRPISVADGWAGAEMRVFALSQLDHHGPTNQPTNQPTDGQSLL